MANSKEKLALLGGESAVPEELIKTWPPVSDVDREYVLDALNGDEHTVGDHYRKLEAEFAEWAGVKHALFCNSGTAALHMALVACNCGVGDQVIAPAYTWPSSVTACLHHNIVPVFVDIDWSSMNVDVDQIEAAITPRTRAIIAVHLHGLAANIGKIVDIARKHNLKVIEDCCQSHGALFEGQAVGTFGDCAAFSTNQNKSFTSGEGGFFTTDDTEMFERGKTLWYFGENRPPDGSGDFHTYGMGWMYRSTELTAAFGRAQLQRLDGYLEQQRANGAHLTQALADVPNLILPNAPRGYRHSYYNYTVRFDMEALGHQHDAASFRNKLSKALNAEGAQNLVWQGWPVPKMTVFQAKNGYGNGCPWSCTPAGNVDYSLEQFPVAQRHCDWHTGMTTPLRTPNGSDVVEAVAAAYTKVLTNIGQVESIPE